jgi:hypothetical protein
MRAGILPALMSAGFQPARGLQSEKAGISRAFAGKDACAPLARADCELFKIKWTVQWQEG